MSAGLRRFWFDFDLPKPTPAVPGVITLDGEPPARRWLWRGCGVTGSDEADCLEQVAALIAPDELPPVSQVIADVDVAALPSDVRSQIGVVVWRGIWFPRGSSRWSPDPDL